MKQLYYIVDDSPMTGYGDTREYDSAEAAMDDAAEHREDFGSVAPFVCEYSREDGEDDEFTGRFWEMAQNGVWHEYNA